MAVEKYWMLFLCYYDIFVWYVIKRVWAERVEDSVAELAEVKPQTHLQNRTFVSQELPFDQL